MVSFRTHEGLLWFLEQCPVPLDEDILNTDFLWFKAMSGKVLHGNGCPSVKGVLTITPGDLREPPMPVCTRCFSMSFTAVGTYLQNLAGALENLEAAERHLTHAASSNLAAKPFHFSDAARSVRVAASVLAEDLGASGQAVSDLIGAYEQRLRDGFAALPPETADRFLERVVVHANSVGFSDAPFNGLLDPIEARRLTVQLQAAFKRAVIRGACVDNDVAYVVKSYGPDVRAAAAVWLADARSELAARCEDSPVVVTVGATVIGSSATAAAIWWLYSAGTLDRGTVAMPGAAFAALRSGLRDKSMLRPASLGPPQPADTPAIYAMADSLLADGFAPADALAAARLMA